MMDITVKVPEDRLAEFYGMYATWLSSDPQPPVLAGAAKPLRSNVSRMLPDAGAESGERLPWSERDGALAAELWDRFSASAKALFSKLIDEPNRRFTGEELAEMLGIPNGHSGVAGVLAWPGKWCKHENRELLWKFSYPVAGDPVVYWMTPENAALFGQARDSD